MKTRHGFVSNSSSSSFIVAFPKDMAVTPEAIKDYLYRDSDSIHCYGEGVSTEYAANRIFEDMVNQTPNDRKKLLGHMEGWLDGAPEYEDFRIPEVGKRGYDLKLDWDAYNDACIKHRDKVLGEFFTDIGPDMDVYAFSYSDNSGESVMEHGDTFDATKHICISNH